ncbi:MAG: ABC transporter permease, partial [Thermoguttaceae bacterium]
MLLQFIAVIWATVEPFGSKRGLDSGALFGIAFVISALYATGSAAVLFCNEHEEKTFPFLRGLPISRFSLFAGKVTWLFVGATAFLGLMLLETIPWTYFCTNSSYTIPDWPELVQKGLAAYACLILFPAAWGLFWTTRLRSQMNALLLSLVSASGTVWSSVYFSKYTFDEYGLRGQDAGLLVSVGLTIIAGIWGLVSAYFWYDVWRKKFADKG